MEGMDVETQHEQHQTMNVRARPKHHTHMNAKAANSVSKQHSKCKQQITCVQIRSTKQEQQQPTQITRKPHAHEETIAQNE